MVASISASLNLPWLCEMLRGPANNDSQHPRRQRRRLARFIPLQCADHGEIRRKMIKLLVFEHTSRDFALRQADGHLGIQWGIGSLLYDCAILVSNDGIAA